MISRFFVCILKSRKLIGAAEKYLRLPLIQWMEHVETKPEVRKRLGHINKKKEVPSGEKSQWIDWLGYKQAKYLPLKIHDGDWIALKTKSGAGWLSCWGSVKDEDWCSKSATCPSVDGNQAASDCHGEKFQIQTTSHGPIKLYPRDRPDIHGNVKNDEIAFFYSKSEEQRGGGYFWLSTWYDHGLYTMPCPGKSFTKSDIPKCKYEVFTIFASIPSGAKEKIPDDGKYLEYLRNGDFVGIYGYDHDSPNDKLYGFLLQQYRGV